MNLPLKRVVVTGLGAITPIGKTVPDYWNGLINGVSGADYIKQFDASKYKTRFACEVKDFNPEDYMSRKEAHKLDRFAQFGMISTAEAIAQAGLETDATLNKDRVGVIWGSGIGGMITFIAEMKNYCAGDGTPRFSPFFIPKLILDIVAGQVSIKYGYRGPNYATVSACASSTNAIIDAFNQIRLGKADVMIAGGSEAVITEAGVGGFNSMKAMSENNDDPQGASRPFDLNRDGFVLGEGAATLVLEELEHAKARGAHILAELAGGGMSADAYHITAPQPEGLGVINVLNAALDDANMKTSDIDYINVHGTSTPLGDVAELTAIEKVFGEDVYKLNISATKSMTGHLLGAAGAVEAVASILAVMNDMVPPTINHHTTDPAIDPKLNLTLNKAEKRPVNVAISNTFGFGGHNASVIFKKYQA